MYDLTNHSDALQHIAGIAEKRGCGALLNDSKGGEPAHGPVKRHGDAAGQPGVEPGLIMSLCKQSRAMRLQAML